MKNDILNKVELIIKLKDLREKYPMSREELCRVSGVRKRSLESAETTGEVSIKTWKMLFNALKHTFTTVAIVEKD